ncbi:MAG: beta-propeller fold lactonase family protein [Mariprofundales bacterium]|nr:beta-propeller fold lactonase family protein [Mariprofundales bacterium]
MMGTLGLTSITQLATTNPLNDVRFVANSKGIDGIMDTFNLVEKDIDLDGTNDIALVSRSTVGTPILSVQSGTPTQATRGTAALVLSGAALNGDTLTAGGAAITNSNLLIIKNGATPYTLVLGSSPTTLGFTAEQLNKLISTVLAETENAGINLSNTANATNLQTFTAKILQNLAPSTQSGITLNDALFDRIGTQIKNTIPQQVTSGTLNSGVSPTLAATIVTVVKYIPKFAYAANATSLTNPAAPNNVLTYIINATTGALTTAAVTAVTPGQGAAAISVTPSGKFAFVVSSGSTSSNVSSYTINATTGVLTPVGSVTAGVGPSAIKIDPLGKFAFVTNYGSNTISAFTINRTTGALTSVGSAIATGTGPISINIDSSSKFVYVANKNSNDLSAYTINATTGALTSVGAAVAAGNKPVSVGINPSNKFLYVTNAVSGDIYRYAINATSGALTATGTPISTGTLPSAMAIDPSGRFAYVANAGSTSTPGTTVSAYTINATSGVLTAMTGSPFTTGSAPSSITIDPSGKFIFVANSGANQVSAYTINATTGALTSAGTASAGGIPISVTTAASL